MQLPNSSSPILAYLNATNPGFVNYTAVSGAANVISLLDSVSGLPASQLTTANQPTFASALGSKSVLNFGGSAYLSFDSLSTKVGETFMIFVVASATSPASANQDVFTLGTSTSAADGYTRLSISGSKALAASQNNSGTG